MLEKAFNDVYTKFKLHFYQNVFQRFATREATLSTVVKRVNKRFPKEDVKKLERMLTIISNELMPELNLESTPEVPQEKKTAR